VLGRRVSPPKNQFERIAEAYRLAFRSLHSPSFSRKEPQTFKIARMNSKYKLCPDRDDEPEFTELKELLKHYSDKPDPPFVCREVVPPSEYDKCEGLLLCSPTCVGVDEKKQTNGCPDGHYARTVSHDATANVDSPPLCIHRTQLTFGNSIKYSTISIHSLLLQTSLFFHVRAV
jgi:hypothetical protein